MKNLISQRNAPKNARGYTLVELLVYASLVALLFGVVIQTAITISSVYKTSRAYLDINSAAITAFSALSRDIRRASSIDQVNSTFNSSGGKLVLLMKQPDGTNNSTAYYVANNRVEVDQNGVYSGDVTQSDLDVSDLTFRQFIQGSTTAVRIEMTVVPNASSSVPALNFYGTYVLRGSYVH